MSVPFAVRFFELSKKGDDDGIGFGQVGQITANSFMKREFGTKLIEGYFASSVELTEVIDTSGAYIPGHGTPTIILIGTRRTNRQRRPTIRTVRSVQGEPTTPEKAENGVVWQAIKNQIDLPGSVSQWISVGDLDRKEYFAKQPWILLADGLEMVRQIEKASSTSLKYNCESIGITSFTLEDDLYILSIKSADQWRIPREYRRSMVTGDQLRDWSQGAHDDAVFPYDKEFKAVDIRSSPELLKYMWPARTTISRSLMFGGKTKIDTGLMWSEYGRLTSRKLKIPLSIAFAFMATHNHFVLDRGGKVFKQTAPVIKLHEGVSEAEHIGLLGLLNSSTACFWLKMVGYPKGGDPMGSSGARVSIHPWSERYEFSSGSIENFPVPDTLPGSIPAELDKIAQKMTDLDPENLFSVNIPSAHSMRTARTKFDSFQRQMITLQEELDWHTYAIYHLNDEDLRAPRDDLPELKLGERAFEIVLARQVAAGEASDEWFKRHDSVAITELPSHWSRHYKRVVQRRIDTIESNLAIRMIERPEYKRRWTSENWDTRQNRTLRSWLLNRMACRDVWFDQLDQPQLASLPRLTDRLSRDEKFVSVATLYAPHTALKKVISDLITPEHVPAVAALRYKPSGLKKRAGWEHVWDLQRAEDREPDGAKRLEIRKSIAVPPKYTSADFIRTSYWQARGKLDVPKERFISYATANTPTPDLYGWAGWDHREQAFALATHLTNTALPTEEITPLLTALLELQPWLDQWHTEVDPAYGLSPAAFLASHRRTIQGEHGLTDDDLRAWRPPAASHARGGRKKTATETA